MGRDKIKSDPDLIKKKKRLRIIAIGSIGLILLIAIAGVIFWAARKKPKLTAAQHFSIAEKLAAKENYTDAYRHYVSATILEPKNSDYHWKVAKFAVGNNDKVTRKHAQVAWDNGMRTKDVLIALATSADKDNEGKAEYAVSLLEKLADIEDPDLARGDIYFGFEQYNKSLEIYRNVYNENPDPELANKIATSYIRLSQYEESLSFLNELRSSKSLNSAGYGMLIAMLTLRYEISEIDAVFGELASNSDQYDSKLKLQYAVHLLSFKKPTDAISVLEEILASNEEKPASSAAKGDGPSSDNPTINRQVVRLYLGHVHGASKNTEKIKELIVQADGQSRELEGERLFYDYVLQTFVDSRQATFDDLIKARNLSIPHPVIELQVMREQMKAGNFSDAESTFGKIRKLDSSFSQNPRIVLNYAQCLAFLSKTDEALQVVSELHRQKLYSKRSLEVFRDLTLKANLVDKSWAAQDILRKEFKDDANVEWFGGLLALRTGKLDQATDVFASLAAKFPENARVELARISVLMQKGNYEQVLAECQQSSAPRQMLSVLEAQALTALGRLDEAVPIYNAAVGDDGGHPAILREYGNVLQRLNKLEKAREVYDRILRKEPNDPVAHAGLATIDLQNQDISGARVHAESAIKADSNLLAAYLILSNVDLVDGKYADALGNSEYVLSRSPGILPAMFIKGICHVRLGQFREAEDILTRYRGKNLDNQGAILQLALAKRGLNKYQESIALVDQLFSMDAGTTELKRFRFELLNLAGRTGDAGAVLNELKSEIPDDEWRGYSAWLLEMEGRKQEAVQVLEGHLNTPTSITQWAGLKIKLRQPDGVIAKLNATNINHAAWSQLGRLAEQEKLPQTARACYRQAILNGSEDPIILNNFAWVSLQVDSPNENEVLNAVKKAHEALPGNIEVLDTYANALLKFTKYKDCIELLKNKRFAENEPRLLYHLARSYEETGEVSLAVNIYKKSVFLVRSTWNLPIPREELESRIKALEATLGEGEN